MTRTTPFRLTTLHFVQIFFTDALTFMANSSTTYIAILIALTRIVLIAQNKSKCIKGGNHLRLNVDKINPHVIISLDT